ncbi:MAG: OmpA family protein [Hyphomonadaceae bacterium]
MRLRLLVLAAGLALAGCDAPAPAAKSDPSLAAQSQTSVVTAPQGAPGTPKTSPAQPQVQLEISTPEPRAKDLKIIRFAVGSDTVSDASVTELSRLARYLSKFRKSVVLTGYTRRMTDLAAAQSLSTRRAEAVRRYLIMHDVGAPQIAATGLGDARPADQGTTEEAMARNDRVEVEIVEKP